MIFFFTDPHIGVARTSNTTLASAKALRERIYTTALAVADTGKQLGDRVVCLGDVFDKHSNPEPIVAQGAHLLQTVDDALGGNHDIKNVIGSMSSLELIDNMMADDSPVIVNPDLSQPYFTVREHEGVLLYFIPHCLNQELFEQSLHAATGDVVERDALRAVLCLHCNVGDAYGQVEAEGSTLSLTDELQEKMLSFFNLIMVGHEHTPQKYHKGKVVVLGNLLPLSFGELADRFSYRLNPETMTLMQVRHFHADQEVRSYNARDLDTLEKFDGSYITIGGTVKPEQFPVIARQIQKIWNNSPETLMVSNVVEIDRPNTLTRDRVDDSKETLVDIVRREARAKGFGNELAELEKMK